MDATIYSVQIEGPGVDPGTVRVRLVADVPSSWLEAIAAETGAAVATLRAGSALIDGFKAAARALKGER